MFAVAVLILIGYTLLLAGKDADSYQLKDKSATGILVNARIKRWHRDGFLLAAIFSVVLAFAAKTYWILPVAVLVRLSLFDLAFNYWSGLNIRYLGSTAWTDQQFVKIFGINGALKKSITFLVLTLALVVYLIITNKVDEKLTFSLPFSFGNILWLLQ